MHLLLSIILSTNSILHAGQVAEYYFSLNEDQLEMKFVIEKEELLHFSFQGDCDIKRTTPLCLAKHLQSNLTIKVNGKKINLELENSYTEQGHLIVYFKTKLTNNEIETISIQNQCFYQFDSEYKNRIILDLGKFQKSYLLTKEKDSIHLK